MIYDITTREWPERCAPSFARALVTKYHFHRTGMWQDPTGRSRKALCGTEIGKVSRQVATSAVPDDKKCKTCLRSYRDGAR